MALHAALRLNRGPRFVSRDGRPALLEEGADGDLEHAREAGECDPIDASSVRRSCASAASTSRAIAWRLSTPRTFR